MSDPNREKFQRLRFEINLRLAGNICEVFEKNKISTVLIKGLAAAVNYPKPFQRNFSDIDLAVDPKDFKRAEKIILDNNFNVDLHKGLRHLDTLEWDDLYKSSRIIKIDNIEIRVLCAEDHLRVLCTHWLNDGGADRTRLWDIYYALEKNAAIFDWQRFYGSIVERRRRWLLVVLAAAAEYLGMNISGLSPEATNLNLPDWIKREIESEWRSDIRLMPLTRLGGGNKKYLFAQIGKRVPPNVLQAIVETESDLGKDTFYFIRMKDFIKRSKNSIINLYKS